jgi:hypothetical protein
MADVTLENALASSTSPYLRQHKENPVAWQEWSEKTLDTARELDRPIFVSVGYATCHWCHVMAAEAFSDDTVADYLNTHFVPVKVDREQRPDIDQFLMSYLLATQGQGGWPLNAVLSPELEPFFAMTYLPVEPRMGMPGIREVLEKVFAFYHENRDRIRAAADKRAEAIQADSEASASAGADTREGSSVAPLVAPEEHVREYLPAFDGEWGGRSGQTKFPPHTTLLFLSAVYTETGSEEAKRILGRTLDMMAERGLADHLQGGFFRYCVDRSWTIPHFEKMLYDQALLLWVYAFASSALGEQRYAAVARSVYRCLEETFRIGAFYVSAHDADTEHVEGGTYVWTRGELEDILNTEELEALSEVYDLRPEGNFEGRIHLVKRGSAATNPAVGKAEAKLLEARQQRPQPEVDDKVVTSWNALAAIGLFVAGRALDDESIRERALELTDALIERMWQGEKLAHSASGEALQEEEFLEDYAALLAAVSHAEEERPEEAGYHDLADRLAEKISSFRRGGGWEMAANEDFFSVQADTFDSPTPAPSSLAEFALLRHRMQRKELYEPGDWQTPWVADFQNLVTLMSSGFFTTVESEPSCPWERMPTWALRLRGEPTNTCHRGVCSPGLPDELGASEANTGRGPA